MKKAWLALVFGSALFLAACGGNDKDTTAPDNNVNETEDTANNDVVDEGTTTAGADEATLAQGEDLVQKSCTSCHGGKLEGAGNFPALAAVGAKLSEEEIHDIIVNGKNGMPPGILKGEDAAAAAAYLATLK